MELYDLPQGSSFLVSQKAFIRDRKKLLVLFGSHGKYWEIPGGLVEYDEPLSEGLIREVREETGLAIDVGSVVGVWERWEPAFHLKNGKTMSLHIIYIGYLCRPKTTTVILSDEHTQYRWVDKREARAIHFHESTKPTIKKHIEDML